jgi:hypothetical protein
MSIKERLEGYLRNHHGWIPSANLQKLVMERTSYTPQNVGCRLRELAEEGKLEVMYVRNHAHYRSAHPKLEAQLWPRGWGASNQNRVALTGYGRDERTTYDHRLRSIFDAGLSRLKELQIRASRARSCSLRLASDN